MKKQKKVEKKPIYAILYARQALEGNAVNEQLKLCRKYAEVSGYIVEKDAIYKDTWSGMQKYPGQPGLLKILEHVDKHPKRQFVVVVRDLSRISRDRSLFTVFCEGLISRDVRLEYPTPEESIQEQLKREISGMFAKYDHDVRRARAIQSVFKRQAKMK